MARAKPWVQRLVSTSGLSKIFCVKGIPGAFFSMFTPVRSISVVVFALALSTLSASATVLALAGTVKDTEGRPISGAQISIEGKEGSAFVRVVTTDAKGRYNYSGLGEGTFNVTLRVNGTVKAAIANVRVWEGDPTQQLNFALTRGKVMPQAKGKHYVWIPGGTGTNLSGSWMEVDERPRIKNAVATQIRMERSGGAVIQRIQDNVTTSTSHP